MRIFPSEGLVVPRIANPLTLSGFSYIRNWSVKDGVLKFGRGLGDIYTLTGTTTLAWLGPYTALPGSSAKAKLFFIRGTGLYRVDEDGGNYTTINGSFLSGSPSSCLSGALFRNHFLIGGSEGLKWVDPSNDTNRAAGVAAPTGLPTAAEGTGGNLTGTYRYTVTYVNDRGHESNPKMTSGVVDYEDITVTAKQVSLTSIPIGPTGTSKRRIYRTIADEATFMFLYEVPDNTTTVYTDNTKDIDLGTVLQTDNNMPPSSVSYVFVTAQRVYLLSGDGMTLYASKIDPYTEAPNWEAYPSSLSLELQFGQDRDGAQRVFEVGNVLYVAGVYTTYCISGDIALGVDVYKAFDDGVLGRFTGCMIGETFVFLNGSKQLKAWNGEGDPQEMGGHIQGVLDTVSVPSGLEEPYLIYSMSDKELYLSFIQSGVRRAIFMNPDGSAATYTDAIFYTPAYFQGKGYIAGQYISGSTYYLKKISGLMTKSATILYQYARMNAVHPDPGNEVLFGRIAIEIKCLPIVSYVPPTLKVNYKIDEEDWKTKYIDMSYLSNAVKTVYVPVHDRGKSIQVQVDSVNNTASLAGVEIYSIDVEVQGEAYREDNERRASEE